jgi:2-amino-4-hydroxy-6-hydroxymethyldihydropteridine diphosphokinase
VQYSSIYLTEPTGVSRQPDFYNCAAMIKTTLSPHSLLSTVKRVENELGREPDSHFLPRPIDIDILLYGDVEVDSLDLMIPHSRLSKRAFVLVPLLEINPDLIHPISFKPLREYIANIDPPQKVERVIDAGELFQSTQES